MMNGNEASRLKNEWREAMILEKKLKNLNTEDLKKFIGKYFPDRVFP